MRPTKFRMAIIVILLTALFFAMGGRLMKMQVVNADYYTELSAERSRKTYSLYGKRGTIYDTNMIPLAYDRLSYNVTFYRDPSQTSDEARQKYTESIIRVIKIIESNGKKVEGEFWLERDENNEWRFNTGASTEAADRSRIRQWRSNFYLSSETKYPVDKLFDTLCKNYALPDDMSEEDKIKVLSVWQEQRMNNFNGSAIVIAEDVGYECVCQIEAAADEMTGIEIQESSTRVYPQDDLAPHTIGYISKITSTEALEGYQEKGYPKNALVGQSGLEASLEDYLSQYVSYRQGKRVVEVNRRGKTVRELDYEAPVDGSSVITTLDITLQAVAQKALGDVIETIHEEQEGIIASEHWQRENEEDLLAYAAADKEIQLAETGALVAMDCNTGRVLALASWPTFDLSLFEGELDQEYWTQLVTDERAPTYNRAISTRDTPGSIFKMVTALGALMEGATTLDERISDGGYYEGLDTSRRGPHCWISDNQTWKHANQDVSLALAHSCNYYFYELGFRLGINNLNKWAAQLGLTSKTGIELNGESTPFVGSQDKLYDAERAANDQYTSKPIIAYNTIISKFKDIAKNRGEAYDQDKMEEAAKMILDLADSDLAKDEWTGKIYEILQVELGIPRSYIASNLLGNEFFYMINDLRWTASETIMAAIGQSITQVTPIAVARYASAIANGGTVYNAQIVDKIVSPTGEIVIEKQPVVANVIEGADDYLTAIRNGMKDVSAGEEGTATAYFNGAKYMPAAKTGTSQRTNLDVENNAWLVTFAPQENPKIVVIVYVQNGYAGSHVAKAAWTVSDAYLDGLRKKESTLVAGENTLAE